jgi:hypothetical protein
VCLIRLRNPKYGDQGPTWAIKATDDDDDDDDDDDEHELRNVCCEFNP